MYTSLSNTNPCPYVKEFPLNMTHGFGRVTICHLCTVLPSPANVISTFDIVMVGR